MQSSVEGGLGPLFEFPDTVFPFPPTAGVALERGADTPNTAQSMSKAHLLQGLTWFHLLWLHDVGCPFLLIDHTADGLDLLFGDDNALACAGGWPASAGSPGFRCYLL